MNATTTIVLQRAASRLGLALLLSFLITVAPTVVHALATGGPIVALDALISVTTWIVNDLRPF